jgi:hypothetical protein
LISRRCPESLVPKFDMKLSLSFARRSGGVQRVQGFMRCRSATDEVATTTREGR